MIFSPSPLFHDTRPGSDSYLWQGSPVPPNFSSLYSFCFSRFLIMSAEKTSSPETTTVINESYLDQQNLGHGQGASQKSEGLSEPIYPASRDLTIILLGLCLSVFCVALDNTIIATAVPRITDDFHALQDVGWYGSAYLLTTCAFSLFYGKLYSLFNIKAVFLSALFIFEVGSLVCALAPTSKALIIGVCHS